MFPGVCSITASRGGIWSSAFICPLTGIFRNICILVPSCPHLCLQYLPGGARFSPGFQPSRPLRVVVAFPHTSTPGCGLAPGAMATLGGRGAQESMSLLLHPPRACEGFGRLPQASCPRILSSKSITTGNHGPCAAPGQLRVPPVLGAQSAGSCRAPLLSEP